MYLFHVSLLSTKAGSESESFENKELKNFNLNFLLNS